MRLIWLLLLVPYAGLLWVPFYKKRMRARARLRDQPPNVSEQVLAGGGLGHPDGGIAAVADELRADL